MNIIVTNDTETVYTEIGKTVMCKLGQRQTLSRYRILLITVQGRMSVFGFRVPTFPLLLQQQQPASTFVTPLLSAHIVLLYVLSRRL